jgi:hypothetical protein
VGAVPSNVTAGTMYVIDPTAIGVFYTSPSRFLADPYSNLKKNTTSLRLEQTALFHVRNVQGAFVVGGGS